MTPRKRVRNALRVSAVLCAAALSAVHTAPARAESSSVSDLAAARAVFEKNLQAIRDKNREAYLSC